MFLFYLKNTKINIVKRKINIFTKFLNENNPETMTDPPVEYLRNVICHLIVDLFTTTFMYVQYVLSTVQYNMYIKLI